MTKSRRIICIGNSHLQALRIAASAHASVARSPAGSTWLFVPIDAKNKDTTPLIVESESGDRTVNPAVVRLLDKQGLFETGKERVFVSALSGNVHNAIGLVERDEKIDVVIPGRGDLPVDRGARIVPIEQFLSFFRQHYQPFFDFFSLARNLAGVSKAAWIEPPPPIPSNEYVKKYIDKWFRDNFAEEEIVLSSPLFRYKLWLLNSRVLREEADREGWVLIPTPPSTIDGSGFRVREAWAQDATHGSAWYGEEVLKEIEARIGPGRMRGTT